MNESGLILAIIGHLVGDYLLQNDWMALNKKHRTLPCLVHCFLWTGAVIFFSGWHSSIAALVLFTTHFIQDRTKIILWWMEIKWKDQSKFTQPPCGPWSIIVVDNVWHIVTIWAVWKFLI